MVAGLLLRLGIWMGPTLSDDNEDTEFITHAGYRDIFTENSRADEKATYLRHVTELIQTRNNARQVWGWKDPIASFYIRDIFQQLRAPHYIFVTRDLGAVAQREMLEEGNVFAPPHMLAHIYGGATAMMDIAGFLAGQEYPTLVISYERSLAYPRKLVDQLAAFVGAQHVNVSSIAKYVRGGALPHAV